MFIVHKVNAQIQYSYELQQLSLCTNDPTLYLLHPLPSLGHLFSMPSLPHFWQTQSKHKNIKSA